MVLILSESDVSGVLTMSEGVRLVEEAFADHATGNTILLPRVSQPVPGTGGTFRIMAAVLPTSDWFGLKTLTGYPGRRTSGETYFALLLFEMKTGALRAVMAANHLTGIVRARQQVLQPSTWPEKTHRCWAFLAREFRRGSRQKQLSKSDQSNWLKLRSKSQQGR